MPLYMHSAPLSLWIRLPLPRIRSLDGFGTDVYLHLNRLGTCCENLPTGVLYSPSMRDSSLTSNEVVPLPCILQVC